MAFRISELLAGTPPYLGTALLELSVVNGDAARTLGLKVGDEVKVTW